MRLSFQLGESITDLALTHSQSFESNGLIYVPTRKQWFPPTSCMWTKSTRIAGKVAIAVDFPSLEDFFVRDLEVQEPDKSTYIMELETLCRVDSAPSILQVKDLLWEINSYEPSTRDVDILKPLSFLPIKEATGELRLHNVKDVFVLFDRQGHTETFQGKVASLDFDIEDIRLLRPIIDGLGLASRYTSKLAEKESCAPDAVLEPSLSRDLQSRAHAIFRYFYHGKLHSLREKANASIGVQYIIRIAVQQDTETLCISDSGKQRCISATIYRARLSSSSTAWRSLNRALRVGCISKTTEITFGSMSPVIRSHESSHISPTSQNGLCPNSKSKTKGLRRSLGTY